MEKATFKIPQKQTRYDLIKEIAEKCGEKWDRVAGSKKPGRIEGKWLGRLKGIDDMDIIKIYQSANAYARDRNIKFAISWNWHLKEILKK